MRNLDYLIYRAEKLNEAKIQYKLGIIYLEGDRVEPDLDEAKRWLERAADQEHEEAARALEGLDGKPKELQVQMGDDALPSLSRNPESSTWILTMYRVDRQSFPNRNCPLKK